MLARPETKRCIECGTPYEADAFHYWKGNPRGGPAYFCDRGILCSPQCSLAHFRRRESERTLPDRPAFDPFDLDPRSGDR